MAPKLNPESYTVGWICPLEVEQIAALEMLDEEHERLPQSPTDHNVYNLGSIAGHNVVIAGLHQPGNNPAATVVTQMRITFPNLRFGLLVGIGGGVPVKTDNGMIRLGDIVVSKPAGGHSGAVQYDHGKAKLGQFERTGALAPPPAVLLNAAQDLAARRARSRTDPIGENIKRIDTSIRGLRRYKCPGIAQDYLFERDYIHRETGVSCDKCVCDPLHRVQRATDDDDDELYVVVHRGIVASGELVIKDAILRDNIAEEYGILCFEMEAAGALADFPCLVIRGISDYCDSHKNDQWHGYSAAAAAAYARQLFFHMPIDEVKRYISSVTEDKITQISQRQDDQHRQNIVDWLTPFNYGSQQSDYIQRRQAGTGQWLLDSEEFGKWLGTKNQTLFCPGIPGAGKTILTSIVVEDLNKKSQSNDSFGIAYLYCNFNRKHEQKAEHLLLSLLKQLIQEQSNIPKIIQAIYDRHKDKHTRPSLGEISEALQSVTATFSQTFIIVDALDECEPTECRTRFLPELFRLQANTGANLFATSRINDEISNLFIGSLTLEIGAIDDDIETYLNAQIFLLQSDILDEGIQDKILTEIIRAADGMFLLVVLYMNILKDLPTKGDIKEALQNLAKGAYTLNEIYEQAMERIEDQRKHSRELAKQILAWIIYAQRPLSTGELQHALAVKKDTTKLNSDYLPSIKILRSICAGLVTVDEESGIIRLVHYTTQEYFNKNPTKWFLNAEAEITTTCIIYLSFSVFQSGICQTDNEFEERLQSYQLYDYASRYWGHHARKASILCDSVIKFLRKQAQIEASSQALMAVKRWPGHTGYSQEIPRQMTGLHLAAYFGLDNAVQVLGSNSPDQKDSYRRTPLSYAAKGGHEEVVKLLLATGQVDINTKDEDGWTPLSRAAWEGYKEVVNLLFITGQVDINAKDKYGWTLLSRAAWEGHEEAVKLLLATGQVDFNIKDKYGRTPLSRAAERGHEEVVKLLLATGQVDANAKDNDGETPLWRAANEGHEKVVKLLLATGQVDINAKDEYSETLLWRAANEGQEEVVKLLLATGQVDINAKDEYGRTPLSRAIEKGYKGIIKLLNCTI